MGNKSSASVKYAVDDEEKVDDEEEEITQPIPITQHTDIKEYCKSMLCLEFYGQTTTQSGQDTDHASTKKVLNLGLYLSLIDKLLHEHEPKNFPEEDEEYIHLLKLISVKRRKENETSEKCFRRLKRESFRFFKAYKERGVASEECNHEGYWGTRQQLLAGKVIADWLDVNNGPIDAIFGVLLNPTAGRVGPGDTGWIHNILFDDTGYMAYHSAVHDGFGYLKTNHNVGPGYDYLGKHYIDASNCMAGQISGINFWREVVDDVEKKLLVINQFKL